MRQVYLIDKKIDTKIIWLDLKRTYQKGWF